MKARLAALVAVALLASSCGGKSAPANDAAVLVPADALAYVTVDRAQLRRAGDVLAKLPLNDTVLRQIRALAPPASKAWKTAGPQVDAALLDVGARKNVLVAMTQPLDEKAFDAQLPARTLRARIRGWVVFSNSQAALDAVRASKDSLADAPAYRAAAATLPTPGDAVARAYVTRDATDEVLKEQPLLASFADARWVAVALSADDDALKVETHTKRASPLTEGAKTDLADEIPAGAILALQTPGAKTQLPAKQLADASKRLGIDVQALLGALDGPAIAYVRAAIPIPEVTIAARPKDPKRALRAVGDIVARFANGQAKQSLVKVDGGVLLKTDLGSLAVYHGRIGDEVIVTDSPTAPEELKGSVGRLTGTGAFKDARDAAGLPDDASSFLFVNLKEALPAVEAFAQLANQQLPPEVVENVRELRTLLVFTARDATHGVDDVVTYVRTR